MLRIIQSIILAALVLWPSVTSCGQEIRAANGMIIEGSLSKVTKDGLEIKTRADAKLYTWEILSVATRHRYDPVFRANYDLVLEGVPRSEWTRPPDPDEVLAPTPKQATRPATTKAAHEPSQKAEPQSQLLFDNISYENIDAMTPSLLPELELRHPDGASYMGFQYGPAKTDVVYLVYDGTSKPEHPDTLFVWGLNQYTKPVRATGAKRGSGEIRNVFFRKLPLKTAFGSANLECTFESVFSGTLSEPPIISFDMQLSNDANQSRFILGGPMDDLVEGSGMIPVKGLIDIPAMWLGLEATNASSAAVVGTLTMSGFKIVPKSGMDTHLALTVVSENGQTIVKESVRLDESAFGQKHSFVVPLKKVSPQEMLVVQASMNLGPFLGEVSFEDRFSLPK